MPAIAIRPALSEDAAAVAACVCGAYVRHILRIGRQPGPMLQDYAQVLRDDTVYVAVAAGEVVGVLVLATTDEGFCLDNIAVRPDHAGQGLGRRLLALAEDEARRAGRLSIYLYTHAMLTENQALYRHNGYVEYDRRVVNGFPRVSCAKRWTDHSRGDVHRHNRRSLHRRCGVHRHNSPVHQPA